ncbi:hypothetical protein ACNKHS_01225 [Shigella flexneri]
MLWSTWRVFPSNSLLNNFRRLVGSEQVELEID